MTGFPDGPGIDLSGVFTPDTRCGRLRRELRRLIKPALDAGMRLEDHPAVAGHLAQLRFAEDRFAAVSAAEMQVRQGQGNGEFPGRLARPSSESKPDEGLSTNVVAALIEASPRTVRNLFYQGRLEGWRIRGGVLRFDAGSVNALISQRRKESDNRKAA